MKSYSRQQVFAYLMSESNGRLPLRHDPGFGLFLHKKGIVEETPPFDIYEGIKQHFGVSSGRSIPTKDLVMLVGEFLNAPLDQRLSQ